MKEIRYGENAPNGPYVWGKTFGLRVVWRRLMTQTFPICFFAQFSSRDRFGPRPIGMPWTVLLILAKYLVQQGMRVACPLDFGKAGTPRVEYGNQLVSFSNGASMA